VTSWGCAGGGRHTVGEFDGRRIAEAVDEVLAGGECWLAVVAKLGGVVEAALGAGAAGASTGLVDAAATVAVGGAGATAGNDADGTFVGPGSVDSNPRPKSHTTRAAVTSPTASTAVTTASHDARGRCCG
jgi:hypothetical protein